MGFIFIIQAWGQAPQWGKKAKNGVNKEKYRLAKRAERYSGEGERAAEPGDMPLIPPFHDTRFWYYALIGQMSSCWQIRGAVDSIALFQYPAPTIREKILLRHWFRASNTNFFVRLFVYHSAPRTAKSMPVICCRKKKNHSKYGAINYVTFTKRLTCKPTFKRYSIVITLPSKPW